MDYFPISLNLNNKNVVVVGGGKIAERKVLKLIEAGAKILVISPDVTNNIHELAQSGKITLEKKAFNAQDLRNAFLIIAATNNREVNMEVKAAAAPNQLICLVDNLEESNFILPSVINRGKLHIAVSTSGASPMLAKKITKEISETYGEEYKEYTDFLFSSRQTILREVGDPSKKQHLLSAISGPAFLESTDRQMDFAKLMNQMKNKEL